MTPPSPAVPEKNPAALLYRNLAGPNQEFWRRQWHPTPVLLPGKSHGQRSLVGCSPWVAKSWTRLSDFTFTHWRRKWQPTPVFLPGESQGWGSLVGCHLGGHRVGHDWSDLAHTHRSWNSSLNLPWQIQCFTDVLTPDFTAPL